MCCSQEVRLRGRGFCCSKCDGNVGAVVEEEEEDEELCSE